MQSRSLLALSVVLSAALAGCAAAPEEPPALFGLCPQWVQGPGSATGSLELASDGQAASANLTAANLTHLGKPLDMYRIRLTGLEVDGGMLRVRAYANGNQVILRDLRPEVPRVEHLLSFGGTNQTVEFEAVLTSILHEQPPAPGPLRLEATLDGGASARFAYEATFHYKVCGAA